VLEQLRKRAYDMSRLAPMRRFLLPVLALGLGAVCALALAACGGNSQLLSGDTANQLNSALDKIAADANRGACSRAASAAGSIADQLNQQTSLDSNLRSSLIDGFQLLKTLAENPSSCLTVSGTATTPTNTTATQTQTTKTTPSQTQPALTNTNPITTPTQTTPTTNGSGGVGGGPGL
jgi:hypothetical protein